MRYASKLFFFNIILLSLCWLSPWARAESSLAITHYELIQQQSVGKGTYNFIYRADVTNGGQAEALGVEATLTKVSRFVTIIDGELSFGDVPAGATVTSTDTFTVQQGRKGGPKNFPADPYDFEWDFETNFRPVADAGPDQSVDAGNTVQLDGSGSFDPDEEDLTFNWSLTSVPDGSGAILSDPNIENPTFVTDQAGVYEAELVVNDGDADSLPDSIVITAEQGLVAVPDVVGLSQSAATSALAAAGLTVGAVTEIPSSTVPAGDVIGQTPPAGTEVEGGTAVDLLISSGPPVAEAYPQGSFAGTYQGLIPGDATLPEYDLKRFGIITGLVEDDAGSPVSGVAVTILDHPEYGSALTDTDGRFYMPAHGGIELTVNYEAVGFVSAQRTVDVPWNEFVIAPTQVLTPLDTPSTLFFDGNPNTALFHVSSTLTDDLGSREATVIFSGDTQATAIYADGSQQLLPDTLTVRATQFGSDAALPGLLPPTSLFTYCAEFAIDEAGGAVEVQFSQPVAIYLPNFRNFDVGIRVPVGGYDRGAAAWMPMGDGVVAELLDTNTDDIIDALDADGDGLPDDLDGDSFYDDEVFGVATSGQYAAGDTVWRTLVTHFTPIDKNHPGEPPEDSIPPNGEGDPGTGDPPGNDEGNCPPANTGCGVAVRDRVFHEQFDLPGTDFGLHYTANRTADYQHRIRVPASGDTVPASLKRIEVEVSVAGRRLTQSLPPAPNQTAELAWDGRDVLGNPVGYPVMAYTRVGFVYDRVVTVPSDAILDQAGLDTSFAAYGDVIIGYGPEITLWRTDSLLIPVRNTATQNASLGNGWSLTPHHALITGTSSMLMRGDGTARITPEGQNLVWTVAGNGTAGYSGDDGPATDAQLNAPTDVAVAEDGTLYIADTYNHRIRRIDLDGTVTTVAGDGGTNCFNLNEGGQATDASLPNPHTLEIGPGGHLYLVVEGYCTGGHELVRRIDADGIITTVAGMDGVQSYDLCDVTDAPSPGDGGPALDAKLCNVKDIAFGKDGSLYITQGFDPATFWDSHNVIRKIDPDGVIHTVSGEGPVGPEPGQDGAFTYDVRYYVPGSISLDGDGSLLINDWGHYCIRSLDADGRVRTVGSVCNDDTRWDVPDGGVATGDGWVHTPYSVLAAPDGGYYVVRYRYHNFHIVRVDAEGILHAFAGRWDVEWYGYDGDGGPALDAKFNFGSDRGKMAISPDGYLYIADYYNHAIRKIGPAMTASHPAVGPGEILVPERPDAGAYAGQGHIFDFGGKHLRTINLATGVVLYSFHYDAEHRLVAVEDRFGRMTSIQRDGDGEPVSITGPYGDVTQLTIDGNANLTALTFADDTGYQLSYTGTLITAKTDPRGEVVTYAYDGLGRFVTSNDPEGGGITITQTIAPDGTFTTQSTTAEGRVTTYVDSTDSGDRHIAAVSGWNGAMANFQGDKDSFGGERQEPTGTLREVEDTPDPLTAGPFRSLTQTTTPAGLIRTLTASRSYGADGDLDGLADTITTERGLNGDLTSSVLDVPAAIRTRITPEGRVTATTHDPATLLTQSAATIGLEDLVFSYDGHGRITSLGRGTRHSQLGYDGAFLASVTNPVGATTTFARDLLGRISLQTRADSSEWAYDRDEAGNLTGLTEPDGLTQHLFSYTPKGFRESYTSPLGAEETFAYDLDGLLTQRTYPSGDAVQWTYDTEGQLTAVQTPQGTQDFTYDTATGLRTQALSRDGQQMDFSYDGGLLTSATWSGPVTGSVAYGYNDKLQLAQLDYAGLSLPMTHDADGLLTDVGDILIARDPDNGLVTGLTDGDFQMTYGRNTYGEISTRTASHGGVAYDAIYTYDEAGRLVTKVETIAGETRTWEYEYDLLGQLVEVERDDLTVESYIYDAVGNRIAMTNSLTGVTLLEGAYTYDADHKLLAAGATSYVYDADGRLAQVTVGTSTTGFDYNTDGTLGTVNLPDGRQITYLHDTYGRRIAREVDGVRSHAWLYDEGDLPLAEYDGSGALRTLFFYGYGAAPNRMERDGATYRIVGDARGTPRLVLDATGAVVKRIDHDAFGNRIYDSNPGFDLPFGFADGLIDLEHELVRFGARDYQPSTGRWTARDPILFKGGFYLYGYVGNDPVNWVDPSGTGYGDGPVVPPQGPGCPSCPSGPQGPNSGGEPPGPEQQGGPGTPPGQTGDNGTPPGPQGGTLGDGGEPPGTQGSWFGPEQPGGAATTPGADGDPPGIKELTSCWEYHPGRGGWCCNGLCKGSTVPLSENPIGVAG